MRKDINYIIESEVINTVKHHLINYYKESIDSLTLGDYDFIIKYNFKDDVINYLTNNNKYHYIIMKAQEAAKQYINN